MSAPPPLLSRDYRRVSIDRFKRAKSTRQQGDENAEIRPAFGVAHCGLPDYIDDDRSASRYARRRREDFDQLIADLEHDTFGANVLHLWESSRGSRQVKEWVYMLELLEKRRILVLVTTHNRMYDPRNHRDRRSLLSDAVEGEYQSAETSRRVVRDFAATAAAGRPHGPIPYGYRRIYDQHTKELLRQEAHPVEAEVVRELVARLLAGHTMNAIAVDFTARGIRNHRERPFAKTVLREMALNESYAGKRVHFPLLRRAEPDTTADRFDAIWPELISPADHLAVVALLTSPERLTRKPGKGLHLLSMIALCDVCSSRMAAHLSREMPYYRCHDHGCVTISKPPMDQVVEKLLLSALSREDVFEALMGTRQGGGDAELAAVRVELAEAEADHRALESVDISPALAAKKEPAILVRLAKLRARERELLTPLALRGLITPGSGARKQWEGAPMSAKREIARRMLSRDMLGELRVTRAPRKGPGVPTHVRLVLMRESGPVAVPEV